MEKCRDETKGFRTEEVCDVWPKKGRTAGEADSAVGDTTIRIEDSRYFLVQRFCVLCFEICTPSLFSPSLLWSAIQG